MSNINAYFTNSQLSSAAYAKLSEGMTEADIIEALKKDGMVQSQAEQFAAKYTVIDQCSDSSFFGLLDGSGFSATLFWDGDKSQYTFAMRGTETSSLVADVALADIADIGGKGIAARQGVDLFNYYQRLITPKNEEALQLELVIRKSMVPPADVSYTILDSTPKYTEYMYLQTAPSADGLELLTSGEQLNIAGHSLGGQLAMMMGRMFNGSVNEVYTYNAPGFDTDIIGSDETEWFFDAIAEAQIREAGGTTVDLVDFPAAKFNNFVIPDDLISDIGTVPGVQTPHYGETSNIPGVGEAQAHFISTVTDPVCFHVMPMRQVMNHNDNRRT